MTGEKRRAATEQELQELVKEADTGAREPAGWVGQMLLWVAVGWSAFQVWYASPLPFVFGVFILNDTEARAIHLGFALFLAFTAYPAFRKSPRDHIPAIDWVLALAGAFAGSYLFLFMPSWRRGRGSRHRSISSPVSLACCCCSRRRAARSGRRWSA